MKKLCDGEIVLISDQHSGLDQVRNIKFLHKGEDQAICDCWAVYVYGRSDWRSFETLDFYVAQRVVFI